MRELGPDDFHIFPDQFFIIHQLSDRQFWQVENAFMSVPCVSPVQSMSVYEINTIGD